MAGADEKEGAPGAQATQAAPAGGGSADQGQPSPAELMEHDTLPDPLIGQVIADRYRIESLLGRGGMGSVYLCEHVQLKKRMALKMLADEFRRQPALVARFLKEARAAAQIGHPNIVDVFDLGELPGGGAFIAMALLEGEDLQSAIRHSGPMPFPRVRTIVGQICRALAAAHSKGIVHRDMKPANVFLARDAEGNEQVKILDFGIAQVSDGGGEAARLTQTGAIVGTPTFMSPEQGRGLRTDHRTDIYSVGCILYNLITGDVVFEGNTLMAVITKHLFDPPPAPSVKAPLGSVSAELDAVVLRALAKEPDQRFQTMKELWTALESLGEDPLAWPEMASGRFPVPTVAGPPTPAPGAAPRGEISTQASAHPGAPTTGTQPGTTMTDGARARGGRIVVGALVVAGGLAGAAALWWPRPRDDVSAPASVGDVSLELKTAQAAAQATIRGRLYPLPLKARFSRNTEAEMVEVTAPGAAPRRMWVTLDRDLTLDVALAAAAPPPPAEAAPAAPPPPPVGVAASPTGTTAAPRPARPHGGPRPAQGTVAEAPPPATATPAPAPPQVEAPHPAPPTPPPAPPPHEAAPATSAPRPAPPPTPPAAQAPLALAPAVLQQQLHAHRSAVEACIAEDPAATGRLGYRLLVAASGRVEAAQLIAADTRYPAIERCLARTLSSWTVAPAPGRPAQGRLTIELD